MADTSTVAERARQWPEALRRRIISAEAAAQLVKSGDLIRLPLAPVPLTLLSAVARRRPELRDVRVLQGATAAPLPWTQDTAYSGHIDYATDFVSPHVRAHLDARRGDFIVTDFGVGSKVRQAGRHDNWSADVFMALVSEPDARGLVSFGYSVWYAKSLLAAAKLKIAEVAPHVLHTGGDNFAQLAEFDHIVLQEDAAPLVPRYPELSPERLEVTEVIGAYVSTLVNDRDTIQIGTGTLSSCMGSYLTEKHDLGIDSEILVASAVELVKSGVATGRYKTSHAGVATASIIVAGCDFAYCHHNPLIQLYDIEYVNHLPRIARIPNLVAINQASAIDLTGQVAAEAIGARMYTGPGGQLVWSMGALFAPGGRAIHVLPSTAQNGHISRIVAQHAPGTVITVPRTFVDFVVTEFGIANLQGRSQRERAAALIELAHPDFRNDLRAQAHRLFWP